MAEPSSDHDDFVVQLEQRQLEREYQATLQELRNPKRWPQGLVLIGSLALFVLVQQGQSASVRGLATLVGVLFFHEIGHFTGMRLFGYRDVRMFFIPFFGAAVSGRRSGVAAWKEAVVLLLGPVPGIGLALLLAMNRDALSPVVRELTICLVSVNGFNLLPLAGLDGARLLAHLLFSRQRWLDITFRVGAALALAALALAWRSVVLGLLAYWMLMVLPLRWRVLGAAARLRERNLPLPDDARSLEGEVGLAVFKEARPLVGAESQKKPAPVAAVMDQLVDAATAKRPTAGQTAVLVLAWILALLVAFATLGLIFRDPAR